MKKHDNLRHTDKTISKPKRATNKKIVQKEAMKYAQQAEMAPTVRERDEPSVNRVETRLTTGDNHSPTTTNLVECKNTKNR